LEQVQSSDSHPSIRATNVRFNVKVPIPITTSTWQFVDVRIRADVDIREGQYVVVGKTGLGRSDNALILVLTARVVG
jgi:hypothetical protein